MIEKEQYKIHLKNVEYVHVLVLKHLKNLTQLCVNLLVLD